MKPVILCAAVTGGGPPRSPHVPVTPQAVVQSALQAWRAGAAMLHLHARRPDGSSTMDAGAYRELARALRQAGCTALLNFSAGDNGGTASHEERLAIAETGADLVTIGAGSFNSGPRVYDNAPAFAIRAARGLREARVAAEVEVFDTGHLHGLRRLLEQGDLRLPVWVNFVFGGRGGMPADARLLPVLLDELPPACEWTVTVQGASAEQYHAIAHWALAQGGHVRTGLEDQSWVAPGVPATDNAQLVRHAAELAVAAGRAVATPEQARALLHLTPHAAAPLPQAA
ncbi:MAG TPA: 3-keto-5-aminohexanoate cleavage protein [Ramlibacter sp.]|nr:3-keto-5-aminohexanoate cleavage protein [Ramlibacter sp.]